MMVRRIQRDQEFSSNPPVLNDEPGGSNLEFTCPKCGGTRFTIESDGTHIDNETRSCWEDLVCHKCHLRFTQWYEVGKMVKQDRNDTQLEINKAYNDEFDRHSLANPDMGLRNN